MSAPALKLVTDTCARLDGERPPLITPGKYEMVYYKRWLGYLHGRAPKMAIIFRIITEGDAYGKKLARYYNLKSFSKKRGDFRVGWQSSFIREYARLFGLPRSLKQVSMAPYHNVIITGEIKTVTNDSKQKPLPDDIHYSVIKELLGVTGP